MFRLPEGQQRQVTVSIGVSSLTANAQAPGGAAGALVAAADKALYEAKHRGRNQVMAG